MRRVIHRNLLVASSGTAVVWGLLLMADTAVAQAQLMPLEVTAVPAKVTPIGRRVSMTVRAPSEGRGDDISVQRRNAGEACADAPEGDRTRPLIHRSSTDHWVPEGEYMSSGTFWHSLPPGAARLCVWLTDYWTGAPTGAGQVDVSVARGSLRLVTRRAMGKRVLVPAGWRATTVDGGGSAAYVTFAWPENDDVSFSVYRSVSAGTLPRRAKQLLRGASRPYMGRGWMARADMRRSLFADGEQLTSTTVAILHRGFGNGHSRLSATYPPAMKSTVERMLRRSPAFRTLN